MTRIVKSIAVVDDRPETARPAELEAVLSEMPILKKGYAPLPQMSRQQQRDKQSYVDELNRVKVEIAQAKAELRGARRELEETREQLSGAKAYLVGGEFRRSQEEAQDQLDAFRQQVGAEAEAEREQLISDGRAQAEELRNQGYLEGFNKGYEEARAEFVGENQPSVERLQEMLDTLSGLHRRELEQNREMMVQLVLAVAEKIVSREVAARPETVSDMLRRVLEDNKREEYIKITLAPDLLPVEARADQEVRALLEGMGANITVGVDSDMEPGSCLVETGKGLTDIGIHTQLNNIGAALLEE